MLTTSLAISWQCANKYRKTYIHTPTTANKFELSVRNGPAAFTMSYLLLVGSFPSIHRRCAMATTFYLQPSFS